MNSLDLNYLKGITKALTTSGYCSPQDLDKTAHCVGKYLEKNAEEIPGEPTPEELSQVATSGISDNDIQAAAKVIKMVAEMKQQADLTMGNMADGPQGQQQAPMPQQQAPQAQAPQQEAPQQMNPFAPMA